jgi:histone-lysine N-methyltransferase ASH1L
VVWIRVSISTPCPLVALRHQQIHLHSTRYLISKTMLSAIVDRMNMSLHPSDCADLTRASSSDSINSVITVDNASNAQSSSSTPPTSIGDSASISSTSLKLEDALSTPSVDSGGRTRRARTSVGTYNVKVLSGTAIHAPRKFCKERETGNEMRRRTISGDTLVDALASGNTSTESIRKDAGRLVREGIAALDLEWSVKHLPKSSSQIGLVESPRKSAKQQDITRRKSTRSTGEKLESLTKKLTVLGKRKFEDGLAKAKRDLRNLADTKEFAKIDTEPVVHEVWSRGKLVVQEPPKKKKKIEEAAQKPKPAEPKSAEKKKSGGKKQKVWLNKGLYAGQEAEKFDWFSNYTAKEKEQMDGAQPFKENKYFPMPMWHGQRLLHVGRNFKLPFDVCSPMPPGQPKPDEWRKTSSSKLSFKITVCIANFLSRSICRRSCSYVEEVNSV